MYRSGDRIEMEKVFSAYQRLRAQEELRSMRQVEMIGRDQRRDHDTIRSGIDKWLSRVAVQDLRTPELRYPLSTIHNPRYDRLRRTDAHKLGYNDGLATGYNLGSRRGVAAGLMAGFFIGYTAESRWHRGLR